MPDWVKFRLFRVRLFRVANSFPARPDAGGLGKAFPLHTMNSGSRSGGWVGVCTLGLQSDISQILTLISQLVGVHYKLIAFTL